MTKVILLHGGPGMDDSYFYPFFKQIDKSIEITSYRLGETYNKAENIDQLITEFISFYESNPAEYILGHSFGGALAIEALSRHQLDIKKLILCSWIIDSKWIDIFFDSFPEAKDLEYNPDFKQMTLSYLNYYFVNKNKGKEVLERMEYDGQLYENFGQYITTLDLNEKIKKISQPICSIVGDSDAITSLKYVSDITNRHKLKNYVIKDSGHFPWVDNPEDFFNTIEKIIINEEKSL